jgi:hypothetical protein
MQTIEFQATVRDDGTIAVPQEYEAKPGAIVRVILMPSEDEQEKKDFPEFNAVRINTKGWKFCREEANERR